MKRFGFLFVAVVLLVGLLGCENRSNGEVGAMPRGEPTGSQVVVPSEEAAESM